MTSAFDIAKEKRRIIEEEKKREEALKSATYYTKDKEHIEWMGIEKESKVFRIIGNPVEARETPYDPKIVYWSKIINDTGKSWVNIYHPVVEDTKGFRVDDDWILNRLYEKVTESQWHNWGEGETRDPNRPRSTEKGYFISKNDGLPSYNRVTQNKKEGSKQFGHFRPRKRVVINVIDRMDEWCVQNKHTKILTSNYSPFVVKDENNQTKTLYFNDVGISDQIYELFYSEILQFRSHWDLDLIIYKEEKKYSIRDCFEEKIKPEVKKFIKQDKISQEELNYEKYDLDKLFKHSGYYKLFNNFQNLFKQVDLDLRTNFFDELKHLYEEEKVNREKELLESSKTVSIPKAESSLKEEIKPVIEVSSPVVSSTEKVSERRRVETTEISIKDKLQNLPGWKNLDDSDREELVQTCVSVEGETLKFKAGVTTIPCSCSKKVEFPDSVWHCPLCPEKVNFE